MRGYNSTITRKKKICVRCGEPEYIFSKGRCHRCAKIEDFKPLPKHSDDELDILINDLDIIFSKYIRLKYSDGNGMCGCFTCSLIAKWKELQNGHFIPRGNMFLRFDERNSRPQCNNCNCVKRGNIQVFAKRLNEEHEGITDILYEEAQTVYKFSRDELKQMIADYSKRIKLINIP